MMQRLVILLVSLFVFVAISEMVGATETGTKYARHSRYVRQGPSDYAHPDSSDVVLVCPGQEADTTGQCIQASTYNLAVGAADSIAVWYVDITRGDVYEWRVNGTLIPSLTGWLDGPVTPDGGIRHRDAFDTGVVDSDALADTLSASRIISSAYLSETGSMVASDGTLAATNDFTVAGETTLGDALGDSVTVVGSLIQGSGQVELSGDITAFGDLDVYGDMTIGDNNAIDDLDITADVTIDGDFIIDRADLYMKIVAAGRDSMEADSLNKLIPVAGLDSTWFCICQWDPTEYQWINDWAGVTYNRAIVGITRGLTAKQDTLRVAQLGSAASDVRPFRWWCLDLEE